MKYTIHFEDWTTPAHTKRIETVEAESKEGAKEKFTKEFWGKLFMVTGADSNDEKTADNEEPPFGEPIYEGIASTTDGEREYDICRVIGSDDLVRIYENGEVVEATDIDYELMEELEK